MPVLDLFSKRQKCLRGDVPDVYRYDKIPDALRVQIVHIWQDSIGDADLGARYRTVDAAYRFIVDALRREYGVFRLAGDDYGRRNYLEELVTFLLQEENTERVLDAIELSFRVIDTFTRQYSHLYRENAEKIADGAIAELAHRFREHAVGYGFEGGRIIRVDSELIHQEAVKPALRVLRQKGFEGAEQEFLKAYEHYRKGEAKDALNNALKALESTMKAICDKNSWPYDSNATSRTLIEICFKEGLIPPFWQSQMAALRTLLETSVPTARNKLSGHGQGAKRTIVAEHVVAYVLHMAASVILFLTEADRARQ